MRRKVLFSRKTNLTCFLGIEAVENLKNKVASVSVGYLSVD